MKFLKIAGIIVGSLLLLAGVAVFFGIKWVNNNIESLINTDPDRAYNINFEVVDFDYLRRVIIISEVKISPVGDQKGVFADGRVSRIELNKLNLWKLFVEKELVLKELVFAQPYLVVYVPEGNPQQEKAGEGLKGLFGDILSRGEIENFKLGQANVQLMENGHQTGALKNLNVLATALQTDSLKVENPIPFDYGRILISLDSIGSQFPNGQVLRTGKVEFDTESRQLKILRPSMKYEDGPMAASSRMKYQVDMIEFSMDSLVFSGLEANSNLYSNLDIQAKKLEVTGLILDDFRNQNIPRPPDELKPMFQGLVQQIDFPLKLDTLRLIGGAISYGESVRGSDEQWKFQLRDVNGTLANVTSIPEVQSAVGQAAADFTATLDGAGAMTIDIDVPYDREAFELRVSLVDFPLPKISDILRPLMNGRIETGELIQLELKMTVDSIKSVNQFRFDYTDLKIEMFQKNTQKKNRVTSALANILLNQSNLPEDKKYVQLNYVTDRHRYRGPFHLIWKSTKEGILQIVPGGAARQILNTDGK